MESLDNIGLITCCLSYDSHMVNDSLILKCGGNCCKSCVDSQISEYFKCGYCKMIHHKGILKEKIKNPIVDLFLRSNRSNLIVDVKEKLKSISDELITGEKFSLKFELIEEEIEIQIESLKNKLDNIKIELLRDLNKIRKCFEK